MPLTAMDDDDFIEEEQTTPVEQEEPEERQEEPPEKEQEDEPEKDDDDKEKLGRRAQKRINALLARSKAAEDRLRWFEEQQSVRDTELEDLRKRLEERESRTSQSEYEKRRAEIRRKKKQAIDDGDSDAQLAADEELEALRMEEAKRQWEARQQARPERAPAPTYIPTAEKAWQEDNSHWFTTRPDEQGRLPTQVLHAAQIYQQLEREGLDKEDEVFYEELDRRLHVLYPDLKPTRTGEKTPEQKKPRSQVGAGSRTASGAKRSTKFSDEDKKSMIKYGFGDPADPNDQKAWMQFKNGGGL